MKEIFLLDNAIISPLGFTTSENLQALRDEKSGLQYRESPIITSGGYYAGIIDDQSLKEEFSKVGEPASYTKLEQMMILAIQQVVQNNENIDISTTGLIISTTKGNIDILQGNGQFLVDRIYLSQLARVVADFFGFRKSIVVSNACISGGLALVVAKRLINSGRFSNVVVAGGDIVSDFVVSGFQSFMALSPNICRPFSRNRNGINLGEAAAAVLVTGTPENEKQNISLLGEGSSNDSNHISGPSRTGEGLLRSIEKALKISGIGIEEIGYISAHGTGTIYNDEMEANAFHRAGLEEVPVNSFKAYYGHTLGASALLESIITVHSLLNNELFKSLNYEEPELIKPLNIIKGHETKNLKYAMKTASGFGGCNIAMIFKKGDYGI